MRLHHEESVIRVHCPLMICRGHIRASKDALQIFLCVTVLSLLEMHSGGNVWRP